MDAGELKVMLDSVKADFEQDVLALRGELQTHIDQSQGELNALADEVKNLSNAINGVSDRLKALEAGKILGRLETLEFMSDKHREGVLGLEAREEKALHLKDLVKAFEAFAPVVNVTSPVEINVPEAKQPDLTVLNATLEQFKPQALDLAEIVKAIQEGFKTPPNITVKLEPPAQIMDALAAPQTVPVADSGGQVQALQERLANVEQQLQTKDAELLEKDTKIVELQNTVQEVKLHARALIDEMSAAPVVEPTLEPDVIAPDTATLEPESTLAPKNTKKAVK